MILLVVSILAASAFGWGDESHKAIVRGAVAVLPAEMRGFFLANREFIAQHSLDPDYIPDKTQEQKSEHFLDIDAYGQPPFADLPHDRAAAEEKFGRDTVIARGTLPWTVSREFDRLAAAFRAKDWGQARLAAAHLAHFVADTTMPLHATVNYDGQLTGNQGIHNRIEVELVLRYYSSPLVPADRPSSISYPIEWAFQEIVRSLAWCPLLFQAEKEARARAPLDTEEYYAEFNRQAEFVIRTRLRDAATALAGLYLGAWEKAGRPALPPTRCYVILMGYKQAPAEGCVAIAEIAGKVAALADPFDAIAIVQAQAPKSLRRISFAFASAADVKEQPRQVLSNAGDAPDAFRAACRSLSQFPPRTRRLIVVNDGWADDPKLAEALPEILAAAPEIHLILCRPAPEDGPAQKALAHANAKHTSVGDGADVAGRIAAALAPWVRGVDAP